MSEQQETPIWHVCVGDGWRAILATMKDGSIEFEMAWNTASAEFTAIRNAFFNRTPIQFAAFDGDVATLRATMVITNFSCKEPLEETIAVSVTAKPIYAEHPVDNPQAEGVKR